MAELLFSSYRMKHPSSLQFVVQHQMPLCGHHVDETSLPQVLSFHKATFLVAYFEMCADQESVEGGRPKGIVLTPSVT